MKTCPKCNGEGLLFDLPGEPYCEACGGCGDVMQDGSPPAILSHGEPPVGRSRGFKTGDRVRLKDRSGYCVGIIRKETRYTPTDGKGPVYHFSVDELSSVASCVVRPRDIELCDKRGVSQWVIEILKSETP